MNDISSASLSYGLANTATAMKSQEIAANLGAAMLKEVMDQQKMMAQALAAMMQQAPSIDPQVGRNLDISA